MKLTQMKVVNGPTLTRRGGTKVAAAAEIHIIRSCQLLCYRQKATEAEKVVCSSAKNKGKLQSFTKKLKSQCSDWPQQRAQRYASNETNTFR